MVMVMVLVMVALYRVLDAEFTRERLKSLRARQMIEEWVQREAAAQQEIRAEAARTIDRD